MAQYSRVAQQEDGVTNNNSDSVESGGTTRSRGERLQNKLVACTYMRLTLLNAAMIRGTTILAQYTTNIFSHIISCVVFTIALN